MPSLSLSLTRLDSLSRLSEALERGTGEGAVGGSMTDASYAYMGAMRDRFRSASSGDGTWTPLSPKTIALRLRKQVGPQPRTKGKRTNMAIAAAAGLRILYDSGQLYNLLAPGEPGFYEAMDANSKTVGTSDRTARWHQDGTSKMPARPILVEPDDETLARMKDILASGYRALVEQAHGWG